MGAWGINTFENDNASDWLTDFCDERAEEHFFDAFSSVNEIDEYLEAPQSSVALAVAEIVAGLMGKPSATLPDKAQSVSKLLS